MPEHLTPRADLPSPTEGDDFSFNASFTDGTGSPIDITGWTVSMTIAERQRDSGSAIIERDITTHDDATGGKTSWGISGSETANLVGTKRYDIQVVKSDGTTRTIALGTIDFTDGVTDRDIAGSGGSAVGATAGASIDVTLDGDGGVALNVRGLTNYTDSDAVGAIDGAAITPKQVDAEVISSGELSVGGNGPVTGVWGDSGEYVVLDTQFAKKADAKTAQSWSLYTYEVRTPRIIGSKNIKTGIKDYYLAFAANMGRDDNDDTATTSMRFRGTPASEATVTGTTTSNNNILSPLVPVSSTRTSLGDPATSYPLLEAKTDKGTASYQSVTFYLVGEIA